MRKTVRWSYKQLGGGDAGEFEGHASVFGFIDRQGDVVMPGAFRKRLNTFLDTGIILFNHDANEVVGTPLDAKEDDQGLWFRARIADTPRAQEVRALMQEGVIKQLSFGYQIFDAVKLTKDNIGEFADLSTADAVDIERAIQFGFALTDLEVLDISPVSIAANRFTDIASVKAGSCGRPFDDEAVAVLGAVGSLIERMNDIVALRRAKSANVSTEFVARLDALQCALGDLRTRIASTPAPDETVQLRARELHARMLALTCADHLGA